MPELPEVENTVRFLREQVSGCRIDDVRVHWDRMIDRPDSGEFIKSLKGCRIIDCARRGKFIVVHLQDKVTNLCLLAHMRMSGSFDVVSARAPRSKHDHVIFELNDGREIRFHDPRKFGRFYLVENANEIVGHLGLEPLDMSVKAMHLVEIFSTRRGAIKAVLLNQTFLAGVGNIYADEALWAARIHPTMAAQRLKKAQVQKLLKELRRILRRAIVENGTDNGDGVVNGGAYEPRVYGKSGQPCPRCGTALVRTVVTQRGTSFCKKCQSKRKLLS